MRDWILGLLACPFCGANLGDEESGLFSGEPLWFLRCVCGNEFPVFLDRPILVPRGRERWVPAIDQAVGWAGPRRSTIEAVAWLGEQFETGRNLAELVKWRSLSQAWPSREEWVPLLEGLEKKAELRRSGEWFRSEDGRWERMLEQALTRMPRRAEDRPILDEFTVHVAGSEPRRLLDVASGGGFAITRILSQVSDLEYAVAAEKDLKCLWTIQYRAEYVSCRKGIGSDDSRFEAVGADARRLPFKDESFDFATTYHSLAEICGISDVLAEVHRVLERHGMFQLSYHDYDRAEQETGRKPSDLVKDLDKIPLPPQSIKYISKHLPTLDKLAYRKFLEEADLFTNLGQLEDQLGKAGFDIVERHLHPVRREWGSDFILQAQKT